MSSKNKTSTTANNNNNNENTTSNNNIRKYLVLLHDCLAIKFSPLSPVELLQSPVARRTSEKSQNKSSTSTIQSPRRTTASAPPVTGGDGDYDEDEDGYDNEEDYDDHKDDLGKSFANKRKQVGMGKSSYLTSTSSRQVDQSLKGLLLYKEFRDLNLRCFWNAALQDSFEKLEYKGTVVPSTILVGSPIRRHLTILKTAFSRKMLKCPEGFQIEFVGEIEELIADPIEKSHFIPLSDSLCWAIHELTSSGQEAFVDEILMELSSAFPETVLPPKEMIYQVLERLTKEMKVYQTSQGYFVVTPDTHRYIVHTDPTLMFGSPPRGTSTNSGNPYRPPPLGGGGGGNKSVKGRVGTLDSLKSRPPVIPEIPDDDDHTDLDFDDHYDQLPSTSMKRCNSLRNSMKRSDKVSGCLPRKTFSMRGTKSRSKDKCTSSPIPNGGSIKSSRISLKESVLSLDVYGVTGNETTVTRRQKHKSFLKKLLTFRRTRRGRMKDTKGENPDDLPTTTCDQETVSSEASDTLRNPKTMLTMSTQTSNSVENLPSSFGLLSIANPNCNSSSAKSPEPLDSDSGRYTESSSSSASPQSEVDIEISNVTNDDMMRSNTPTENDLEHIRSLASGAKDPRHIESRRGQHNHSLAYESSSPSPSSRSGCDPLGNPKWNPTTLSPNLQSRCTSSASSSISSYRELYNRYRRKTPSYQQQQHNYNHNSHRQCHTLGSSGYVTPPPPSSSKPHSPFRYPPRPFEKKQIYKEMSNQSCQNKVEGGDPDGLTGAITGRKTNKNDNKKVQGRGTPSSSCSSSTSMTTTVTQTLKNSTNLELELLFPLGKLISAALTDFELKSDAKEPLEKQNDPNGDDGGIIINNSGNKEVIENSKNVRSATPSFSATSNTPNPKSNTNLKEKAERDGVISQAHTTTVNDFFTINCKSFIKTNLNNDGLTSTMEFKTMDSPASKTNTYNININNSTSSKNSKPRGTYVVEPVSYKPFRFTNFESTDCRESEII